MIEKQFHVTWDIDLNGISHEEAALQATGVLMDPGNTATIFTVEDDKGVRVVVDTEGGKAVVIRDERPYPSMPPKLAQVQSETVEQLRLEIERKLALLRELIKEPVSILYGHRVDIEVLPVGGDERLLVGRKDWGHTVVNYTHEGLVVDVWSENGSPLPEGPVEPVSSQCFFAEDLKGEPA